MKLAEAKSSMNHDVMWNGSKYRLTAIISRIGSAGEWYHTFELLDKNNHSVCIVQPDEVERI